jgi:cytochrome c-type biogenesis protein CcmE
MSVDQELARAVEEAEADSSVAAVVPAVAAPTPTGPKPKRSMGLLIALLVMVAGVLTLVFTSFQGSAIYSVGVDQLMKEQSRYGSRSLKVKGMLVKGSLVRRDEPCEYRFKIEENGSVLAVRYPQCVVPDTFRDMPGMDVEVTVGGKLAEGGMFAADYIVAKCPSKYEMQQRAAGGEAAPHIGQQASPLQTLSKKE